MPYEQNFEFHPSNERYRHDEQRQRQPRGRHDEDRRRDHDQRRSDDRQGSRYDHDASQRGDRHDDYDRSQPRGDYGRDQGSFSYGRRQEYNDQYDTDNSFSTSRERQNPSAFQSGLGPGHYEGDYRGGRGYYSDEDARWRRGHDVDRPDNRGRRPQDPYDERGRAYDRPSGYGQPGEQVRQIGDQYGHDGYDGSSQGGRYREDNRYRNDDYPGRDRARDDRDGRYHYDDDQDDRRSRRR
ncbi:hypothetical protein LJ737_23775 [Hymenobacter sp. 15J16-1T3B]|uniref:hypothetical protein n=1 Tax=Hymenobacter sp. 15J16-1T3B TaxID=2886941 RepID=UPI001D127E0A|nr:hypothetical protein [Hymenobacter sp. 15J16-1T3B]MCC3160277.1 hypothetical protein [Hymenobacter sp. 15J16-1T3B]